MPSALWKIAALASVMGIAGFVLFEIHGRLPVQTSQPPDASKFIGLEEGEGSGEQPGADEASTVQLGNADTVGSPPEGQGEPEAGGHEQHAHSLGMVHSESDETDSPFRGFERNAPADDPVEEAYNPFADSSLPEEPAVTDADQPLVTADARRAELPGSVEQVSAAQSPGEAEGNPFASFDWPTEPTTAQVGPADDGAFLPLDEQSEPASAEAEPADVQLAVAAAGPDLSRVPEQRRGAAPELTFAADSTGGAFDLNEPYDPTAVDPNAPYDPTLVDPQTEPAAESAATTLTVESPAGQFDGQAPPAQEAVPVFDFGPTASDAPATGGERFQAGQQAEPAPRLDFGSEPGSVEPSRLPANVIEEDGPPARTALRTRDFAPLQPAQNLEPPADEEPAVQIIPNPSRTSEPAAPSRSDFVGDAIVEDSAPAGPQQPELTIQKVAPPDATVGDPLVYAIKVKNIGNSTAHDVVVEDRIPRGTTLEGSIPQAELTDRKLVWQLGHMEPGDEKTIRIKVVPTEPGEIGSVATVRFVAQVAATTRITTPSLTMDLQGPGEVAVGEQAVFKFKLANIGEGEARNVYVRNLLPPGFEHPGGRDIEYDVGSLRPGESRDIELSVRAATEGVQTLTAQLNTGTTTRAESQSPVKVIASRLLIKRTGPKHRFVGRPADYTTTVTNQSSNVLQRVTVVEQLPAGMELAAAPDGGHFDAQRRTITWRIAELPPGGQTTLRTSVIGSQKGVLQGLVQASDASGNKAQLASVLEVAGFASLTVDLEHEGRPVGIGDPVAMQLTVKNRGTGSAENVEAQFEIPDHLTFVNAEGPVEFKLDDTGRTLRFAAIDSIDANDEQTFKIMLTAAAPGNTPVTAELSTADMAGPLKHAEAVIVEADGQ